MPHATLAEAAADLAAGRTTAAALAEAALARIADPAGEGSRAFLVVQAEAARASAQAMDALRQAGRAPSPWAGIPISIKDLYDEAGQQTRGGSRALADVAPATATAPAVARLQRAGFVVLGRTNMVEFAFSGLGHNPHYGTPRSPWDRATGRLPGGSSSGAAVAAADGMGFAGLGSDTGGSCRIPAALCGIVGWKPTAKRVPLTGTLPLSFTLDSLGPIANSVACCAVIDSLMAGDDAWTPAPPMPVAGLRLGVLQGYVTEGWDAAVTTAFEAALSRLSAAGARIEKLVVPELAEIPKANATGGFAASEATRASCPASCAAGRCRRRSISSSARTGRGSSRRSRRARRPSMRWCPPPARCCRRRCPRSRTRPNTAASTCCCCATPPSAISWIAAPSACPAIGRGRPRWASS